MIPVPPAGEPFLWLGGQIDVKVEIDTGSGGGFGGLWDSATWDESLWGSEDADWQDATPYVIGVECSSGAQRWGERFEAGRATITVDNTTGIFTPGSGVSDPWFREYRPGRRVRIIVIPDPDLPLVKVPLFTGRLDSSVDAYVDVQFGATTQLHCVDYMGSWAAFAPIPAALTGAQRTDLRVGVALDRMAWEDRDIQVGDHNVQTSDLSLSTLEESQLAADAEGGAFFASPAGSAVFKSKDWLTTDTRSTVIQGYVGYDTIPVGAQNVNYVTAETSWELARIANDVQFIRVGGTLQHVEDTASQSSYGERTLPKSDFTNTTDGEVLALATRYLNAFKDSRMRVDSVELEANDDPSNDDLNRLMWDTQLGDRLSVLISPPFGWTIEREVHVMGISHHITPELWSVNLRLDDAQTIPFEYWELQDPILGVLGETTRVA